MLHALKTPIPSSPIPNNSKSSRQLKTFHDIPWQHGCSEHTWRSQPHQRHGADTCGWTRCSHNVPSVQSEHKQRTRPFSNQQVQKQNEIPVGIISMQEHVPSRRIHSSSSRPLRNGTSRSISPVQTENWPQSTERRAAVSHMHACIANKSRTQVKAPKQTTPTLHKTPAYPAKSQRRGDHST